MAVSRLGMQLVSAAANSPIDDQRNGSSLPFRSALETVPVSEPTSIEYINADSESAKTRPTSPPHWLSPNYIDLHLRSARLVSCEAKNALHRHFMQPREKNNTGGRVEEFDAAMEGSDDRADESSSGHDIMREWMLIVGAADHKRSFLEESFC
ncbi:hypothetical protein L7F22_051452 [Adiantum nelumboides]|nr:hypothetical protein [Adiantum nelumboides]